MSIGKSIVRVDAYDKVTGRAKYTDDLCDKNALIAKILHADIAHGLVKKIDISDAEKIPGVIKIVTCFDVPKHRFPTAGHPWSNDPAHQDVADRRLLNQHVRYYGDDIAAVVAKDELTAKKALEAMRVEYEVYDFVLDPIEAMKEGAPLIHNEDSESEGLFPRKSQEFSDEKKAHNVLGHSEIHRGDVAQAIREKGLIRVEGWYRTPMVQHCHIENHICYAEEEAGKIKIVSSTQIPHIVRRVVGQALGRPWGDIRIIKPYIGGGFGNKQDALYEPLCAYLCTQVGGRLVKLDVSREETFINNRVRHALIYHIVSYVRKDGTIIAREMQSYSNQGAYASHGHSIAAKGLGAFPQQYPCPNIDAHAYTVYTNLPAAGAMRGYGIPQAMWMNECHIDDIARALNRDPVEYREQVIMAKGYVDPFSKNENYYDSYRECLKKGMEVTDYIQKRENYRNQRGPIRRGIGVATFWYNTAVWPIALETSSCRMVLNQDGSVGLELAETEIGQGADTAFTQMAAEVLGVDDECVHIRSFQDTDTTPFGTGAYASRQTYIAGFSIRQTGLQLKEKLLKHAQELTRMPAFNLDIKNGVIIRTTDQRALMSLEELSMQVLYSTTLSAHITAESTYQTKTNAYSFGCTFCEVEVDIPLCRIKILRMVNIHDCGKLINPQLAQAQVHGGMSMALGFGLSEELLFDQKTGRPLNNNLLDYKLLTSADHPELEVHFIENPEPTSAFGTKSLGEPPTCSGAPAIRNALLNATGVAINDGPLSPGRLFDAFKEHHLFEEVASCTI